MPLAMCSWAEGGIRRVILGIRIEVMQKLRRVPIFEVLQDMQREKKQVINPENKVSVNKNKSKDLDQKMYSQANRFYVLCYL